MTPTATETITLGALAMRLGERIERVIVTICGGRVEHQSADGRDASALINRYYSAVLEWDGEVKVYQTVKPHQDGDKRVTISVRVKGGGKE